MSETVVRHRGGGRNENGQWTAGGDTPLTAIGYFPRGGSRRTELGRDGVDIAGTVYFGLGTDLTDADELTVRGERYRIIVNRWDMGRGGLEVQCVRGQG